MNYFKSVSGSFSKVEELSCSSAFNKFQFGYVTCAHALAVSGFERFAFGFGGGGRGHGSSTS